MKTQSLTRKCCPRAHFFGGSDTRIIISGEEALIRPRHAQDAQMKSPRSFGVITGDSRHTRAHAAQSSTAQAQVLRPIRGKYSRDGQRQRQASANLATSMTDIRRFIKAYAVLWQKLYAPFLENTFDQGDRVLVSRVATDLDICDRVSMKTGRPSQVPNRQIERSTRHPNLCACQQARNAKQSNEGGSK
jgi:hypothetical protein